MEDMICLIAMLLCICVWALYDEFKGDKENGC